MDKPKRLMRSKQDPFGGVAGAFARYYDADEGTVRLIFMTLLVLTLGFFALVYMALWLVLPSDSKDDTPLDISPGEQMHAMRYRELDDASSPRRAFIVSVGLLVGMIAVAGGISIALSWIYPEYGTNRFWALLIVAFGVLRLVVPARSGYTAGGIVEGVIILSVGLLLLLSSLNVISLYFDAWIIENWPLLSIVAGMLILGRSLASPAFIMGAALVFVLFCGIGLGLYADAGPGKGDLMPPFPVPEQHIRASWE